MVLMFKTIWYPPLLPYNSKYIKHNIKYPTYLRILYLFILYTVLSKEIVEASWKPMPLPTNNQISSPRMLVILEELTDSIHKSYTMYIVWSRSRNHRHFNSRTSERA